MKSSFVSRRITIKDIAREAGVHHATVSRALRDDPRIRPDTIGRIKQAAAQLGYEPDPMMKALAAYRTALQPVKYKETLGFVWPEQTPRVVASSAYLQRYIEGARSRAAELGYQIDEFFLSEQSPDALRRVLHMRGIRGFVIGPITRFSVAHLRFPFEKFALAAITTALKRPSLHRVGHDHFGGMRLALHELKRLGYRRIAFIVSEVQERLVERRYSAAFIMHHPLGLDEARKLFQVVPERELNQCLATVPGELAADAVVLTYTHSEPFVRLESGRQIPLISLDVLPADNRAAGINQQTCMIAASAVDIVAEQIIHGRWGVPQSRKNVLTGGVWFHHPSCPRVR